MTTAVVLGKIPVSGQTKLTPVTAPPGLWITKITGMTNPSGATGIQATWSNGKTSNYCGARTGNPYTIDNPTSLYVTGGTTNSGYASSVGTSSTTQFGPVGKKIWANKVCGAGQKLSGFSVYGNDASIYNIQNPTCMTPAIPTPPAPPAPKVQSCAPGQVITKITTYKDPAGKIIGMRYGCSDNTYLPWVGASTGGTAKLETTETGWGSNVLTTAMAPNIVTPLVACQTGYAYNTVTIDPSLKVAFSKPTQIPPPQPVPVVSYAQNYTCPSNGFINRIDSKNATTGLGLQFICGTSDGVTMGVNGTKQSIWYGPKVGISGSNTTSLGYDQIDWTTDATQGVTSITTLGAVQGSKKGASSTFQCPKGQILNGVIGKWTDSGIQSLGFKCTTPPYKVPDPEPTDSIVVPPPATTVVTPTPPATIPDPTGASDLPSVIEVTPPVVEPPQVTTVPDYTVVVPPLNLTSNANTYIMILIFLIVVAVAVVIGVKIMATKPTNLQRPL